MVASSSLTDVSLPGPDVADEAAAPRRGPHEGVDDVVDEHEVPRLLAVPEDRDRLAPQDALGEDGHHAGLPVGILARAVDVGEGQRAELERVQLAVGDQVVDDRLLGHPVRRQRLLGVRLADREVLGRRVPVERAAAGGEHDALGLGLARALEDVQRADDVDRGVEGRSGHRDPDVGLRGEVEDELGPAARHQLDDGRGA